VSGTGKAGKIISYNEGKTLSTSQQENILGYDQLLSRTRSDI